MTKMNQVVNDISQVNFNSITTKLNNESGLNLRRLMSMKQVYKKESGFTLEELQFLIQMKKCSNDSVIIAASN